MHIRKTVISMLILAVAIAFSPFAELRAASLADPGLRQASGQLVHTVKATKGKKTTKRKAGKRHGKRAGSKGPGRCGAYMYYKGGKCMDARKK